MKKTKKFKENCPENCHVHDKDMVMSATTTSLASLIERIPRRRNGS